MPRHHTPRVEGWAPWEENRDVEWGKTVSSLRTLPLAPRAGIQTYKAPSSSGEAFGYKVEHKGTYEKGKAKK